MVKYRKKVCLSSIRAASSQVDSSRQSQLTFGRNAGEPLVIRCLGYFKTRILHTSLFRSFKAAERFCFDWNTDILTSEIMTNYDEKIF